MLQQKPYSPQAIFTLCPIRKSLPTSALKRLRHYLVAPWTAMVFHSADPNVFCFSCISHPWCKVKSQSQHSALTQKSSTKIPLFSFYTFCHSFSVSVTCLKTDVSGFSPCFLLCREPITLIILFNPLCSSLSLNPPDFFIVHSEDLFSICLSLPLESKLNEAGVLCFYSPSCSVALLKVSSTLSTKWKLLNKILKD